ncbi:hypothetical protein [Streptomyces sp. NPDC051016]|uniref:hypothetical protein n=1 Tax=Streptomyces sp. NPDC051016 TaxID=3365638 RepID=UPI0037A0612A
MDTLVFIVSAFKDGVSFANVEGITLNVYDGGPGGQKLGEHMPDIDSYNNACVTAKATRTGTGWNINVVNEMGQARSRDQLLQLAKQYAA